MSESVQRAYLEALDIPVWIRKEVAEQESANAAPGLKLGPGSSELLLVCSDLNGPARRIATDIARCLKTEPVWAWPDESGVGESGERQVISDLVADQLFTTVLVFGKELGRQLFQSEMPETLGSARMLQTLSLSELETSPDGKRDLWRLIQANHLAGRAGRKTR
jgi:hypothetical protein